MKKLSLIIIALIILTACEKELSITEFSEFFDQYEPELRIEALLDAANPMRSLVMVDRSIRVDDTDIFSGFDEENPWQDSVEVISRKLADSTAQVYMTEINSGIIIPFAWTSEADSFQYRFWTSEESLLPDSFVTRIYGAYKPAIPFIVNLDSDYELTVISTAFDKEIRARTKPVSAVRILSPGFTEVLEDTLVYTYGEDNFLYWLSDIEASSYYISIYQRRPEGRVLISSNPGFSLELQDNVAVGFIFFPPLIIQGFYEMNILAMNPDLSRYYVSSLPINNPQVTNLRDQNGKPVMGIFGSYSSVEKIVVME